MLRNRLFDGVEKPIIIYNGQAIIDKAIEYYTEECDEETDFDFPSYSSSYFRIYNERLGREIKEITLSQYAFSVIINASALDMTFEENGNYFYEIGYVQNGGYEIVLQYGQFKVV